MSDVSSNATGTSGGNGQDDAGVAAETTSGAGSTGGSTGGPAGVMDPKILADFGLTSQQILEAEKKYSIPVSVQERFPDLVALLLKTESMNAEEREYWFQVLPVMSDDQVVKLRDILVNEREQLKKIDNDYNDQVAKLGDNHRREWNAFEAREKKKARTELERQHEKSEAQTEESLLKKLHEGENLHP